MAILLALCCALAYGLSDFVGGLVSRRTSAWSVAVVAQLSSALCMAAFALTLTGDPAPVHFLWGALAGVAGGAGTGFLYRGFAAGRMSVVAPVSGVGAALVPVVVGSLGGERLTLLVWLGIVCALPGIWLVSTGTGATTTSAGGGGSGVVDGTLAGLGFGALFALLGQIPDSAGMWPLALTQCVAIPAVVLLATAVRSAWVPRGRYVWWALVAGPLGAAATATFLVASQLGFLTVTGVLASLYPASTVLLAAVVLREKIHPAQGIGLGLCAVAIALVAGG